MRALIPALKVCMLVGVIAAVAFGTVAYGKGKPGPISKCPRDIYCLDVWDPVICDDGNIYSNSCYAYRACATGCESLGDGPFPVE